MSSRSATDVLWIRALWSCIPRCSSLPTTHQQNYRTSVINQVLYLDLVFMAIVNLKVYIVWGIQPLINWNAIHVYRSFDIRQTNEKRTNEKCWSRIGFKMYTFARLYVRLQDQLNHIFFIKIRTSLVKHDFLKERLAFRNGMDLRDAPPTFLMLRAYNLCL